MDLRFSKRTSHRAKSGSLISIGVAFALVGIVCGYFFLYRPLLQMSQHSAHVSFSIKGQFISPVMLITGLFILIAPSEIADEMLKPGAKKSKWFWIWLMMIMAGAAVTYFSFSYLAEGYGYHVR